MAAPSVLRPFAIDHASPAATLSLADRVAAHADYYDAILSLVPPRYYTRAVDVDDDELDGVNTKYFKHGKTDADKAAHKAQKAAGGNARRVRFGEGSKPKTVAEHQAEAAAAAAAAVSGSKRPRAAMTGSSASDEDDEEEEEAAGAGSGAAATGAAASSAYGVGGPSTGRAGSLDELRARLHAKLASLAQARTTQKPYKLAAAAAAADEDDATLDGMSDGEGTGDDDDHDDHDEDDEGMAAAAAAGGKKGAAAAATGKKGAPKHKAAGKPQHGDAKQHKKHAGAGAAAAGNGKDIGKGKRQGAPPAKRARIDAGAPAAAAGGAGAASASAPLDLMDFAFGGVAGGVGPADAGSGKADAGTGKGPSKRAKLRALLAETTKAQRRIERATAAGDSHAKVAAEFTTALKRAEGGKVRDDPTLIAKSLKRITKAKATSAAAWSSRAAAVTEAKADRQRERSANLAVKKNRAAVQAEAREQKRKDDARSERIALARGEGAPADGAGAASGGKKHGGGSGGGASGGRRAGFEGKGGKSFINHKHKGGSGGGKA